VVCDGGRRSIWRGRGMTEKSIVAAVEEALIEYENAEKNAEEWQDTKKFLEELDEEELKEVEERLANIARGTSQQV